MCRASIFSSDMTMISYFSKSNFTNVVDIPVGIASASISLMFLISNEIVKMFLKTLGRIKINTE